jgi:histidinol-phosphate/aromatic aminotransferase/cobyric acid decarboxylase-like protein
VTVGTKADNDRFLEALADTFEEMRDAATGEERSQ